MLCVEMFRGLTENKERITIDILNAGNPCKQH